MTFVLDCTAPNAPYSPSASRLKPAMWARSMPIAHGRRRQEPVAVRRLHDPSLPSVSIRVS
jgi:hypothetical protein